MVLISGFQHDFSLLLLKILHNVKKTENLRIFILSFLDLFFINTAFEVVKKPAVVTYIQIQILIEVTSPESIPLD